MKRVIISALAGVLFFQISAQKIDAQQSLRVAEKSEESSQGFPLIFAGDQKNLRTLDWTAYFNQIYPDCLEDGDRKQAVYLDFVDYHDFDKDGREEAIVRASSCYTGTAGPDIHSVFELSDSGNIRELTLDQSTENAKVAGTPTRLIGNLNGRMVVKDKYLCIEFFDGSGRESPLEQCYGFEGGKFVLTSIVYGPVFQTSFDCRQAKTDREVVVCGNEKLARLDLELHETYQTLFRFWDPQDRDSAAADQKRWLREINAWVAYKGCCEEIEEIYFKRIKELGQLL